MASKTVADIVSDFELRRARRERKTELMRRENRVLQELEKEKRALLLHKLERAFLSGEDDVAEGAKLAEIERKQREIEERNGLLTAVSCPVCGDTGMVHGRYCVCLLDEIYRRLYGATDIGSLRVGFDTFDPQVFDDEKRDQQGKTQRQRMELYQTACRKYVAEFPKTMRQNILLRGKAGLGKTYLLECMAAAAKKRRLDVCLIRAASLFDAFFRHRMGEDVPLTFLHDAQLLLIDDLGTEPITQNVSVEYLFDLLNRRLETGKHTAVATNIGNLQKRYDERIASRLEAKQGSLILEFEGEDLRMR